MTKSDLPLLPCPFCDGAAEFDHDDAGWNWIECTNCQASTNARASVMDDCRPLLQEQWNRRTGNIKQATTKEREACAKVAEGFPENRNWVPGSLWGNIRNEVAQAIRSRDRLDEDT